MGGVSSTLSSNTLNIINETVNSITSDITKKCENKTENIQTMSVTIKDPIGCSVRVSGIDQTINSKVNTTCLQTNITKTELQTKLNNKIDQVAESLKTAGSLSLFDITKTDNMTTLRNTVNNNTVLTELTEAINKDINYQNNDILLDGIVCRPIITKDAWGNQTIHGDTIDVVNINQTIISDTVFKGLQSSESLNKAVVDVDNDISQAAKSTSLGLFDGIATAGGPLVMIIALIVIGCIFTGGGGMMLKKKFGKGNRTGGGGGGGGAVGSNWRYFSFPAMMTMFVFIIIGGIVCIVATSMGLSVTEQEKKNAENAKKSGTEPEPSENAPTIIALFAISIGLWVFTLIVYILLFLSNETMTDQNSRYASTEASDYKKKERDYQQTLNDARTNISMNKKTDATGYEEAKKNLEKAKTQMQNHQNGYVPTEDTLAKQYGKQLQRQFGGLRENVYKITYSGNMMRIAKMRKLLLVLCMLLLFGSIGTGVGSIIIRSSEVAKKQEEVDGMITPGDAVPGSA
jgi:ABC-type multidrug transport system fused ATPase/permease subunit